jgi:hypothetical protein
MGLDDFSNIVVKVGSLYLSAASAAAVTPDPPDPPDPEPPADTVTVSQTIGVDVAPHTQGLIVVSQPLDVVVTGGYSAYSPLAEGNLQVWIDMLDAGSKTISGATLTAYKNRVTGVDLTPGTPVPYEATGWNGKPCIHPTLIGHAPIATEAAVISAFDCPNPGAKPFTVIWYASADLATGSGNIFALGNSAVQSSSTRYWGLRPGVAQYEYACTAPAAGTTAARTGVPASGVKTIISWDSLGVGVNFRENNGTAVVPAGVPDPQYSTGVGPDRYSIGGRPDSTPDGPWVGLIAEVLVFSAQLDAAALTRVYNYLVAKWA